MDDELNIVIGTVLEAKEEESAKRIASQLQAIESKLDKIGHIRVGVELDTSGFNGNAAKNAVNSLNLPVISVPVKIDTSSLRILDNEMSKIGFGDKSIKALNKELNDMGVRVDNVRHSWEKIADEEGNAEDKLLSLRINGIDQQGRLVEITKVYSKETQEVLHTQTNVTNAIKQQRDELQRLAEKEEKLNDKRVAFTTQAMQNLKKTQSSYVEGGTSSKPVTDKQHLEELGRQYDVVKRLIEAAENKSNEFGDSQKAAIKTATDELARMATEYKNIEYVATDLRTKTGIEVNVQQHSELLDFENKLKKDGILTDEFRQKIAELRAELGKKTDSTSIGKFLDGFDKLEGDASAFKSQIAGVNKLYTDLINVEKQISKTELALASMDEGSQPKETVALREQLVAQQAIKESLQQQIVDSGVLTQYAKNRSVYVQVLADLSRKVSVEEGASLDEIESKMKLIPAQIQIIEEQMKRLSVSNSGFAERVQQLSELTKSVNNAETNDQKQSLFLKLQSELQGCNEELQLLLKHQSLVDRDEKLEIRVQKGGAELDEIERKWSALKSNPGLNAQLQNLRGQLKSCNSEAQFSKWSAELGLFKTQVKAAGLNMRSLVDTIKDNIGKVWQWLSATTILMKAFNTVKSAVKTIVELDTAMVEVKKVTDETKASYDKFYYSANKTAKELGATTKEIINQTAQWARLGFTMEQAQELAKNSAIFSTISENMSLDEATDGIVAIQKAFQKDIAIEDVLDGIISKVNVLGNEFAVENKDIVDIMTRSSAAMAEGRNSFEQAAALGVAATEIVRDSASVGTALKTISMRLRGLDEETGETADGLVNISGAIADLTKTASNTKGISIFEPGDPNTYRSTYDVLKDISKIWDELTDKNRAELLEVLFSKRQGQIGSAVISNFSQAEAAMDAMASSAGGAMKEFENVADSAAFKINALKETWVGVAQELINSDALKYGLDIINSLSEGVAWLTSNLGLLGTASATVLGVSFFKSINTVNSVFREASEEITVLAKKFEEVEFDDSQLEQYKISLAGLSKLQAKMLLNRTNLSEENKAAVLQEIESIKDLGAAELARMFNLSRKEVLEKLQIQSTRELTKAKLDDLLATKKIEQADYDKIVASGLLAGSNKLLSLSFKELAANAWAALGAMASNPLTWIAVAVSGISTLVNSIKQAKENAAQAVAENVQKSKEELKTVDSLIKKYKELAKSGSVEDKDKEEALNIQKDIVRCVDQHVEGLDLVNGALDEQIQKLKEIKDLSVSENKRTLELAKRKAEEQYNKGSFADALDGEVLSAVRATSVTFGEQLRFNQYLQGAGYKGIGLEELIGKDAEESLAILKKFREVLYSDDSWEAQANSFLNVFKANDVLDYLESAISSYESIVKEYKDATDSLYEADAYKEIYESSKSAAIDSAEAYEIMVDEIKSGNFVMQNGEKAVGSFVDYLLEAAEKAYPEYSNWTETATDTTSEFTTAVEDAAKAVERLEKGREVLASIREDMTTGDGSVSVGTIDKMKEVTDEYGGDYRDYLVIEGDKLQVNIDKWKEYTEEKTKALQIEAKEKVDSLTAEKDAIEKKVREYKDKLSKSGGSREASVYYSNQLNIAESDLGSVKEDLHILEADLAIYNARLGEAEKSVVDFSSVGKAGFEAVTSAQKDMLSGGLTTDTLKKLQDANGDYTDFLYEQNGELKLNTQAWIENEKAKIHAAQTELRTKISDAKEKIDSGDTSQDWAKRKKELEFELKAYGVAIKELDKDLSNTVFDSQIGAIDNLKSAIENLSKAKQELSSKDGSLGFDTIEEIAKDFGALGLEASKYMAVLMDASASQEDLNNALQSFAVEAINACNADQETVKAMLKSIGIYNEVEEAISDVTKATIQDAVNSVAASGDVSKLTNAIITEANAAGVSRNALIKLAEQMIIANNTNMSFDSQLASLKALATQALISSSALNSLMSLDTGSFGYKQAVRGYRDTGMTTAQAEAKAKADIINAANREFMKNIDTVSIGDIGDVSSVAGGGGGSDDPLESLKSGLEAVIELKQRVLNTAIDNGDYAGIAENTEQIVNNYKKIQDILHQQADAYRKAGYSDTSNEVASLSKLWWDYADKIKAVAADAWKAVSDASGQALDDIQSAYESLHDAANEYAQTGYIAIDTWQKIVELGPQYLNFLQNENGQLVINEENIQKVIKARVEQAAVESALAYVAQLRVAADANDTVALEKLLTATQNATNANWAFVYSQLATTKLTDAQKKTALHNINVIRALSETAMKSIGQNANQASDQLSKMKDGVESLYDIAEAKVKHDVEQQIDAINDQVDAYNDLIDAKKESLKASKDEADYQKDTAKQLKEIAKLQAQIDILSLDSSREAQAKRAKLAEELAELQEGLNEKQESHALETQNEALDKMQEAYSDEKDEEIKKLEDSISSKQKLYDKTMAYIENNWESLLDELTAWNYQYGDTLTETLVSSWDAACDAVKKYGSYLQAYTSLPGDVDNANKASYSNMTLGNIDAYDTNYDTSANQNMAASLVAKMKQNGIDWFKADDNGKKLLERENEDIGYNQLPSLGIHAEKRGGTWYENGEPLFEKYVDEYGRPRKFHSGGIVGGGSLKDNEQFALLKNNEWVLTENMVSNLMKKMELIDKLGGKIMSLPNIVSNAISNPSISANNVTNNGGAFTFAPNINVEIAHNGSMSDSDASRYGSTIAESALDKLRETFTRRGISSLNGALLKA